MDPCYPTEAWSNIPAFQHVSEECEFWSTHTLVDCGDDVCAEPFDYGEDDAAISFLADDGSPLTTKSPMSLGGIHFAVRGRPGEYVAYPIGVEGIVVGQGDTFEEAPENAKSATLFHIETFELLHLLSIENPSQQRGDR